MAAGGGIRRQAVGEQLGLSAAGLAERRIVLAPERRPGVLGRVEVGPPVADQVQAPVPHRRTPGLAPFAARRARHSSA